MSQSPVLEIDTGSDQEDVPVEENSSEPKRQGFPESLKIMRTEANKCLTELGIELMIIRAGHVPKLSKLQHGRRLLNTEIDKLDMFVNSDWLCIDSSYSRTTIARRVLLPPTSSSVSISGRLLGRGGGTLKKICQTYKCTIGIYGKGSTRNRATELALLRTGNPIHSHFNMPLHAEICINGHPQSAYARFSQLLLLIHDVIHKKESFERDGIYFAISNNTQKPGNQKTSNKQDNNQENVKYAQEELLFDANLFYRM